VVVKFDKLNPLIGNTATVPMVGDLMASRWAFEAAMVTQYKDNEFEQQFYLYDKIMADADYKKVYYIPELESRLDFVNLNYKNPQPAIQEIVAKDLKLLQGEIRDELYVIGKDNFKHLDALIPGKYDSLTHVETQSFFEALKKFYNNRYSKADKHKDDRINSRTNTAKKEKEFEDEKNSYQNEAITELV